MSGITTTTKIGSMTITTIHQGAWQRSMELADGDRKRMVITASGIIVANSREHADAIRGNITYGIRAKTATPETPKRAKTRKS